MVIDGQVVVINLPKRKDRLTAAHKQLQGFEVVEAIDGRFVPDLLNVSGFERACIRSHKKAVSQIKGEYITVLEDDFLIMPNIDYSILEKLPSDWWLFYWGHVPQEQYHAYENGIVRAMSAIGAWAYTIKKEALEQVLQFDEQSPYDMQLQSIQPAYGLLDGMIGVAAGYSDIKKQDFNPVGYYLKDNISYQ